MTMPIRLRVNFGPLPIFEMNPPEGFLPGAPRPAARAFPSAVSMFRGGMCRIRDKAHGNMAPAN